MHQQWINTVKLCIRLINTFRLSSIKISLQHVTSVLQGKVTNGGTHLSSCTTCLPPQCIIILPGGLPPPITPLFNLFDFRLRDHWGPKGLQLLLTRCTDAVIFPYPTGGGALTTNYLPEPGGPGAWLGWGATPWSVVISKESPHWLPTHWRIK
jgi:hypothetical protein